MIRVYRRYVFLSYEDLRRMKVKKLSKVCDKAFVFIDQAEGSIPLPLAQKLQKLGKLIQWVPMDLVTPEDWQAFVSFYLGKYHGDTPSDIEFLLLFDDLGLEGLIRMINKQGRVCKTVSVSASEEVAPSEISEVDVNEEMEKAVELVLDTLSDQRTDELVDFQVDQVAREVVERLLTSGNRPAELSMLKQYIQIYQPGIQKEEKLDEIIQKMAEATEIEIRAGEVIYNF